MQIAAVAFRFTQRFCDGFYKLARIGQELVLLVVGPDKKKYFPMFLP